MNQTITAIYENGVLRPLMPLDFARFGQRSRSGLRRHRSMLMRTRIALRWIRS